MRHWQSYLIILFAVCLLLTGGCENRAVREALALERDKRVYCPEGEENRCAIRSLYQELADWTLEDQNEWPSHFVSVLDSGEDALLARIHLIRAARKSIDIQTYIWESDLVGNTIFEELLIAARRGVKIRLIIDQYGTQISPRILAQMASAHANIEIRLFRPIMARGGKSPLREIGTLFADGQTLNQRMHNKVFLVDGRIGIVGGRNIKNHYYDYGHSFCYKDLGLLAIGPVTQRILESFEQYWSSKLSKKALSLKDIAVEAIRLHDEHAILTANNPQLSPLDNLRRQANQFVIAESRPKLEIYPVERIEFVADWPDKNKVSEKERWNSTARLLEIIGQAQREIIAQTPYLIQDWGGIFFLKQLRIDKPELAISLSTNSLASTDHFYVYAVCFKQRQFYLEDLKAQLFEFKPIPGDILEMIPRYGQLTEDPSTAENIENGNLLPIDANGPRLIIHSKFFVVDNHITFVGSHNFDPRARNLNTECALIIWDDTVATIIKKIFERDTAPSNSWVVARRWKLPVIGNVSESIAGVSSSLPLFDLWPFEYSSNFDLREGCEPVAPNQPDFYDCYQDVGMFPRMELSPKWIAVRIIKAFGGLASGYM